MAFINQTINPNPQTSLRSEMSQGANVGDSALGTDGRVYDWTGERWQIAGNQSRATDTDYLAEVANKRLVDEITKSINDLEDKFSAIPGVSYSEEELNSFSEKAIALVKPYYEAKRGEIEAGIAEGKIQNAEDMFKFMRDTQTEITGTLAKYDIDKAQTEEEFINTLVDITASREEDLELKRDDWRGRIDTAKSGQVQTGVLTSGIGKKDIQDLLNRQSMEEESLVRRYGQKQTEAETAQKYDLDRIALARQQVEAERINKLGTAEEQAAVEANLRDTLGLAEGEAAPSDLEMAQRRAQANITVHKQEDLTDLNEREREARESKRIELEKTETTTRERQLEEQRRAILAEQAKKQRELEKFNYL